MARSKSKRRPRRKTNGTRTRSAKKRTIKRKRARFDKAMQWRWL